MQKSASAAPLLVRSSQPKAPREIPARAGFLNLGAGVLGAFQEEAVEVETRIDEQRLVEFQRNFAGVGRGQHRLAHFPLGRGIVQ